MYDFVQTLYTTQCEFESVSDDGVLQVGDWHHLKISIKLAAGTSMPHNENIFYHVVINKDTWMLSVNSSGILSVVTWTFAQHS